MTTLYTGMIILPHAHKEKIQTVKALREIFDCSLTTGKQLVENNLVGNLASSPVMVNLDQLGRLLHYQKSFVDKNRWLVDIEGLNHYHGDGRVDLTVRP